MWVSLDSEEADNSKALRVKSHADKIDATESVQTAIKALPPRLREIALLLYAGETKASVARTLGISHYTLDRRLSEIGRLWEKMGVTL